MNGSVFLCKYGGDYCPCHAQNAVLGVGSIKPLPPAEAIQSGGAVREQDEGNGTIVDKLKPIDRRLPVLKKHLEQTEIYLKFKGKKKLSEADQILFTAATT